MRKKFSLKICYKKKYSFLNLKYTPSHALASRLIKRGNFLKSYRFLKSFYYIYLLKMKKKSISRTNNFLFLYSRYLSFKDFDRVLFWKYKSLNCMFSHKSKTFKKKKKSFNKIIFTLPSKRLLLTINFLKYMVLLNCRRGKKKIQYNILAPLYDFIINDRTNSMLKIKYRIYKLKLGRMQS